MRIDTPTVFQILKSETLDDQQKIKNLKVLLSQTQFDWKQNDPDEPNAVSALHVAAQKCGPAVFEFLLEKNLNLMNRVSKAGSNVLFYAIK